MALATAGCPNCRAGTVQGEGRAEWDVMQELSAEQEPSRRAPLEKSAITTPCSGRGHEKEP